MYFAKNKVCTFYSLKCYNSTEEFYKIGITCRTVKERYSQKYYMPYKYEIINFYQSNAEEIWNIEKYFLKGLKKYKYSPQISFAGSLNECFKI